MSLQVAHLSGGAVIAISGQLKLSYKKKPPSLFTVLVVVWSRRAFLVGLKERRDLLGQNLDKHLF